MGLFKKTEEQKKKDKVIGFIVVLVVGLALYIGSSKDDSTSENYSAEKIKNPIVNKESNLREIATISQSKIQMATSAIEEYPEVREAAVAQNGQDLSLALVVRSGTSKVKSKDLADSFTRQVIVTIQDGKPSKQIGSTSFNYRVVVVGPKDQVLVEGAKISGNHWITW